MIFKSDVSSVLLITYIGNTCKLNSLALHCFVLIRSLQIFNSKRSIEHAQYDMWLIFSVSGNHGIGSRGGFFEYQEI